MLDLAGIHEGLAAASGRSRAAWIRGKAVEADDATVSSELNASYVSCPSGSRLGGMNCPYRGVAVRDAAHAYIKIGASGTELLYSTREDRAERRNIAPSNPPELTYYRQIASALASKAVKGRATMTEVNDVTNDRLRALGYLDAAPP